MGHTNLCESMDRMAASVAAQAEAVRLGWPEAPDGDQRSCLLGFVSWLAAVGGAAAAALGHLLGCGLLG